MASSIASKGFLIVLRCIIDGYTFITWPGYFLIQSPWDVRKKQKKLKAIIHSSSGSEIVFRGTSKPDNDIQEDFKKKNIDTMEKVFKNTAHNHGQKRALGTREILGEEDEVQADGRVHKKLVLGDYHWRTFSEMDCEAEKFGRGLLELGLKPKENIVLFSETRAEWIICADGIMKQNIPLVTLYATLGDDALVHGINETEVTCVITSHELLPKFKNILLRTPKVSILIVIEDPLKLLDTEGYGAVKVISYLDVVQLGEKSLHTEHPPTPDDIAIIMFTSGSTGVPKGVLLSHRGIVSAILAYTTLSCNAKSDLYMAYLPLAHVLELIAESICMLHGIPIGYSTPLTMTDKSTKIKRGCKGDASVLQPTMITSVPLMLDRIYKAIQDKFETGPSILKIIFDVAIQYKIRWYDRGYSTPIIDRVLLKPIRKLLGGKVRIITIGSAPLSPHIHSYIRAVFCCPVVQGYAMTETSSAATVMDFEDRSIGTTGGPLQCCEIKLVNWEEGNYSVRDIPNPRGEIHIGGSNVAVGYYKQPEKTEEEFYEENGLWWFRTGDIGEFTLEGNLKIIDRKKDLVKLQHGEYISLGKIEAELKSCSLIDNMCMYADPTQTFAVALLTPNADQLKSLADKNGLNWSSLEEMCKSSQMEKLVLQEIQSYATKSRLNKFETPQKVKLISEVWTPDTELVTAALKLKRKNIQIRYQHLIDIMYA